MATGKYAPRDYAPDPNKFGKDPRNATWPEPPPDRVERARTRAAHIQAAVAERVRLHLEAELVTRTELLRRTGWKRERLSRILNGNIVAGLDDLMLLLDAAGSRFENIVTTGTAEHSDRRQHLNEVQRYLRDQHRSVQAEIARIEQEQRST